MVNEKITSKDALQLRLILEETILKYRDALSESAVASLRFSHFFGSFRISLRVEGERFDPFTEDDPSETSVMGSLLANTGSLNRAWLLAAFLLLFILSVATPPVLGGTTVGFSILFSQLGINAEALAMIISVNAIFEFLTVAVNNYCLQSQIVLLGNNLGKLDRVRLKA